MAGYVVVTRHPPLVQVLLERGLIGPEDQVIEHATDDDVRGMNVIGILPLRLAALALSVTEIEMGAMTLEDRQAMSGGGHLSLERTRELAGPAVSYVVRTSHGMTTHGPCVTCGRGSSAQIAEEYLHDR